MREESEIRERVEALEQVYRMCGLSEEQKRHKRTLEWVLDDDA